MYTHTNVHTYICYVKTYIRKQIQTIEGDASLDESERTRRKQVHVSLQAYYNITTAQYCVYCSLVSLYIQPTTPSSQG